MNERGNEHEGSRETSHPGPLFPLGKVVATPGALEQTNPWQLEVYLGRHVRGDWGCVCAEDAATNAEAVRHGNRILSAYPIDPAKPCKGYGDNTLWLITEGDRSVTTFLLPSEY
ncbi:MAG: type I restriction endonuclease subunit M [Bryobacterales bacterium]|nr:type I restriction endonuclease subunit M [Bryobacterales bacterium]